MREIPFELALSLCCVCFPLTVSGADVGREQSAMTWFLTEFVNAFILIIILYK